MDEPSSSDDFKTEISPTEFVDTESVFRLEGEGCVKNEIVQDGEQIWKKDLNSLLELTNHEGKIKTEIEEYDEKPHYDQLENVIVDTFDGSAAGPSGCDKDDIAAHCSVKQECDYEMTEELEIKNDSDIEGMISEDSSQSCSDDTEGEASLQSEGMLNSAHELENEEKGIKIKHGRGATAISQKKWKKCSLCPYVTNKNFNLKCHISAHHLGKQYKCEECDFTSGWKGSLGKHKRNKHANGAEKQPKTERQPKTEKQPKIEKQPKTKFKCSLCEFTTVRRSYMPSHMKTIHLKLRDLKCPHCDFDTSFRGNLKKHMDAKHFGRKLPGEVSEQEIQIKPKLNQINLFVINIFNDTSK